MRIDIVSTWDDHFFEKFCAFHNKVNESLSNFIPDSLDSYKRFFGLDSVFRKDFKWFAIQISSETEVLSQAILSWRKDSRTGNLGFIDSQDSEDAFITLIKEVESIGKEHYLQRLKSPIDLNFFVKYRMRSKAYGDSFFGEPVYPDYYHDLFLKSGFTVIARWESFKLNKWQSIKDYFKKRKNLEKNNLKTQYKELTIRTVNLSDWDKELGIIHGLLLESYSKMPEWENISLEQFKVIYDDFKYIIHPWMSYIVEWHGRPVGFSINFADPLKTLQSIQKNKLNLIDKILLFLRLRLNLGTLLISHVGKIPGPNGEEIKGIQILASRKIQFWAFFMRRVLVTFQVENSPSRRAFEKGSQSLFSEYVLYGKEL